MIHNYFKIAWRNLRKNKTYSFINVAGLSIGLTWCILILLFAKDETSYDRFHENGDQIYRITTTITGPAGQSSYQSGTTGMVQGAAFQQQIPEIAHYVRLKEEQLIVKLDNEVSKQSALYVDSSFFSVFSFELLKGTPQAVLNEPNSLVLTDETAVKYFGSSDVVGRTLGLEVNGRFENFMITGVARKVPQNSTIKFDVLIPFAHYAKNNPDTQWLNFFLNTFLVLQPKADPKAVETKMATVFRRQAARQLSDAAKESGFTGKATFGLQPLTDIHLNTTFAAENGLVEGSNPIYSYILIGIAGFILLIACINFINLTVAQSLRRSKEIGVRKVTGSTRGQLLQQFLGESVLLCLISFGLALILAQLSLPIFNELANKKLSLAYLTDPGLLAGFGLLFLVTAFAAGFYPAVVLSGFQPIQTLYGQVKLTGRNYLARSLVIIQFALATLLMVAMTTIYTQFNYLLHKSLGYSTEHLVQVKLPFQKQDQLVNLFKNRLSNQTSIVHVAARSDGRNGSMFLAGETEIEADIAKVDDNYFPTFQIPLRQGRNFSPTFPTDTSSAVIVNEAFVRKAGWKIPIGQTLRFRSKKDEKLTVIGVVPDFHFQSLKEKINPHIFSPWPKMSYGELWIKVNPDHIPQALRLIEKTYRQLVPFFPYEYQFMDQINFRQYEKEGKWKEIIGWAALFSIFISCIGLFGLATLSIQQRIKEIGVRKVMGASISSIATLLSIDFLRLVILASILAIPLGYYLAGRWLEDFAYRIDLSWWIFVLCGLFSMVIALLTVGFQSIKAALMNPLKSLKTD